jgi:hypothetical protein
MAINIALQGTIHIRKYYNEAMKGTYIKKQFSIIIQQ